MTKVVVVTRVCKNIEHLITECIVSDILNTIIITIISRNTSTAGYRPTPSVVTTTSLVRPICWLDS